MLPLTKLMDLDIGRIWTLLPLLLADKTTKQNIIWATATYESLGRNYLANQEMSPHMVAGVRAFTLQARTVKTVDAQQERTKKHAEVFTPAWICNKMNNHCDAVWFEREDVFNRETGTDWTPTEGPIVFPKGKKWQHYVDSRWLEITCGEAPFLASRYDASTGESIPFDRRIGILDRKLRIVNENTTSQVEWYKWTLRAFESVHGYEFQGDSLLIARINFLLTFMEAVQLRWQREATSRELEEIANIIAWNLWQMDGLKGSVPSGTIAESLHQTDFLSPPGESPEPMSPRPLCRFMDWRGGCSIQYNGRKTRKGTEMKFDFVIGNPPYQEETDSNSNRMPPVYHVFMDAAYEASDVAVLITPARFLFNAGYTPKSWNEKMLQDPYLKVIYYEPLSSNIFSNTDIKGGVAITLRNKNKPDEAIEVFTRFPELNSIIRRIAHQNITMLDTVVYPPLSYSLSDKMKAEHPDLLDRLRTSAFVTLSEVFFIEKPNDSHSYIGMLGLDSGKRTIRYIRKDYISDNYSIIDKWSMLLPEANGRGDFGEKLTGPSTSAPGEAFTQTFICIGTFDSKIEVDNVWKYIQSKFVRALLGVLKVTQHTSKGTWRYVPLQNFTPESDIDWSVSIADIDKQLYRKYGLTTEEIAFIESKVKEMA